MVKNFLKILQVMQKEGARHVYKENRLFLDGFGNL